MQTQHTGRDTHCVRSATEKHLRAKKRRWRSLLAPMAIVLFTLGWSAASARATILSQIAKLLASEGGANQGFGFSVSISGDTAVVGAGGNGNAFGTGVAYEFVRNATGAWPLQAKLFADDGATGDGFVPSLSGDTAFFGAPGDDDNGDGSGSAYVFTRDTTGVWTQQAKLLAADGAAVDRFGTSIALSGDTAIIGTQRPSDNGFFSSGSGYIFVRDAMGLWTQQAKLIAADGTADDHFGRSLSISGDTVIVGANFDDDNGLFSGSAYIFTRDTTGVWTQQAKLLAADGAASDLFGNSVSISGNTAFVGAPSDDDNGADSGSVYIFERSETGVWTQRTKLLPDDAAGGDVFGSSVAISGNMAIIGAKGDDDHGLSSGSVYVFMRDTTGDWIQQAKLLPTDGSAGDLFGWSVAISRTNAIVGAIGDNDHGIFSGSAYVFDLTQLQPCLAQTDFNGDGVVNAVDLATLLAQWGGPGAADITGDGVVDALDLSGLLAGWGPCQ